MRPRELVAAWAEAFNRGDADELVVQRGYWDRLSFLKAHGLPREAGGET
jgi:hypothetical protein